MADNTPKLFNRFMLVPPGPKVPDVINVIVEIPKGRRSKFEVDKELGLIRLDRYLYSSSHYPGDYGFIPQTLAEDGDPLDALVMVNEPTFAGCLIQARPLGLFKMTDKGENDYKILCVPNTDPIFAEHHDLWRVPPHYLREVEHFFSTYKDLEGEGSEVVAQGWDNVDKAHSEIAKAIERYDDHAATKTKASGKKVSTRGKVSTVSNAKLTSTVTRKKTGKKVTRKKVAKKVTKKK